MKTAVVTGASSGIGAATARLLAQQGHKVMCVARRAERVEALANEIDGVAVPCDITNPDDVARLADTVGDSLDVLVNNAGGALGLENVGEARLDLWERMYATNVLGTARVTQALLPALTTATGIVVFVTSIAAEAGYEGGAGYCGAKAAERSMVESMRLELVDTDVRITEIAPGLVATDEFSLTRFEGDADRAAKVYEGVPGPLVAEDIADAICWMVTRPHHVNVDHLTIRPRAQAKHKMHRVAQ